MLSTIDQIFENNLSKFFLSLFPFAAFQPSVERDCFALSLP